MRLYKYLTKEAYARALVDSGELFMRALSYFRTSDDEFVRGDPDDGKLRHQPDEGLVVTKATGEVFRMPLGWQFRASVRANDIFVYCLSTELSPDIAARFQCPFCVEIREPARLIGRISRHVRLRSKLDRNGVFSREVSYRDLNAVPHVDWALPERVAFIKPEDFAWQKEYRIIIGLKGAFAVENVECALEATGGQVASGTTAPDPQTLHVGDLSNITRIHRF